MTRRKDPTPHQPPKARVQSASEARSRLGARQTHKPDKQHAKQASRPASHPDPTQHSRSIMRLTAEHPCGRAASSSSAKQKST